MVGDLLRIVRREIENIQFLRPTALVPLPAPEVSEQRRVDDPTIVRRKRPSSGHRHRQRFRQPTFPRYGIQAAVRQVPAVAAQRPEQHSAVAGPAVDLVVIAPARRQRSAGGVVGQLSRHPAARGHDVDLLVTVVLAGESDPLAVRRELRKQLLTRVCGQACRCAARARCHPQIAGVDEHDLVPVDVGKPQELGLRRGAARRKHGSEHQHRNAPEREFVKSAHISPSLVRLYGFCSLARQVWHATEARLSHQGFNRGVTSMDGHTGSEGCLRGSRVRPLFGPRNVARTQHHNLRTAADSLARRT